jgi:hypothetical protein
MPFGCNVTCDVCGREERISDWGMIFYVVRDNQHFPCLHITSWCFDCDNFCSSERLPPVDVFVRMLAELEANGLEEAKLKVQSSAWDADLDPQVEFEKKLAQYRAALAWRIARKSPPRCLTCGGLNHMPIEWIDETVAHPGCTGKFVETMSFHFSGGKYGEFDEEGLQIVRGTDYVTVLEKSLPKPWEFHANVVYADLSRRRLTLLDRDDESSEHYLIFDRCEESPDEAVPDMENVYLERDAPSWGAYGGIQWLTLGKDRLTFIHSWIEARQLGDFRSICVTFDVGQEQWEEIREVVRLVMKGYEERWAIED